MDQKKRILLCPLDWGLGHATRCIPIIHYLKQQGAELIIGADKRPLALLTREFPELEFIRMPGYEVSYREKGSMTAEMIRSAPRILYRIQREHRDLDKLIHKKRIDGIISDNRYGLWHNTIPCAFITHQVNIQTPFASKLVHALNSYFIKKYTRCWIPDNCGQGNLAGNLSQGAAMPNASHIGPLSRFTPKAHTLRGFKYDLMVILSGPEPQRTYFEQLVLDQLRAMPLRTLVVRGLTEKDERGYITGNIEMASHLETDEMQRCLSSSEIIISRPGYSTIMDLAVLQKKAILVPTPGQTEQEYLGKSLHEKKQAYCMAQKNMDLQLAVREARFYSGFGHVSGHNGFKAEVDRFLALL